MVAESANDFLTQSYRNLGVIGLNQAMPVYLADRGLIILNDMLDSWSLDKTIVLFNTEETEPLTIGQAEYTIGDGGDFDTVRPIRLLRAHLKRGTRDYPLEVIHRNAYQAIAHKDNTGRAGWIAYQPEYPLGKIALWRPPDSADTLFISSQKQLEKFTNLATKIDFAPGYARAIKYNLPIDLAAAHGRGATLDPTIIAIAQDSLKKIKNVNATPIERVPLGSAQALGRGRGRIGGDPDAIKTGGFW